MGQLLSHPIEEKTIDNKSSSNMTYCIGSMQGYRTTMEDAHNVVLNENDEDVTVFGVFDGHGGKESADIVSSELPAIIYDKIKSAKDAGEDQLSNYIRTVKDAFFKVDHDIPARVANYCGTTAIVATIIDKRYILVANTGDSRCAMSMEGGAPKTVSFDHKPSNMGERVRIENGGGYVVGGRVNEILALSRAFGDAQFKIPFVNANNNPNVYMNSYISQHKDKIKSGLVPIPPELYPVSVEPDVLVYDLKYLKRPEFIVLACDGVWDCFINTQLINLIREKVYHEWKLEHIVEYILNDCIRMASGITGIGFDNMTLIIIVMHNDSSLEGWYGQMKHRIKKERSAT
ncbi:Piso0_001779 [Millerozyma farinosa CBS 7064]|uniref:protein-serine/threonine phosphatase n=1 Tax=Pichia sorbitophila (strain ATCC MYA-4447 / BCRC 22081 / CBS 7064 / NBRC 10061 / NRRL Y-12695) TaxID=559304 RepID=G8YP27_PICSO|nr:Piso0_001779 [Millerozyma farinosa CBS 7064]